jgi:hypothetical protein
MGARLVRLTTAARLASDQIVSNEIVLLANVLLKNSFLVFVLDVDAVEQFAEAKVEALNCEAEGVEARNRICVESAAASGSGRQPRRN